jgi:hypothetical protein
VFKVLGISIILMLIMDLTFIVTDTITVNNRIESIAVVIQDELSRNNSVPDLIKPLFNEQLKSVGDRSNIVAKYADGSPLVRWNIDQGIVYNGVTYPPINQANVKQYGEKLKLVIQVKMQPNSLVFVRNSGNNGNSFIQRNKAIEYTRTYVYEVPALRYLK